MHVLPKSMQYFTLSCLLSFPVLPSHSSFLPFLLPHPSQLVRTLLEDLPGIFANNRSVKCAMGAALQAAEKLLVRKKGLVNCLRVEEA